MVDPRFYFSRDTLGIVLSEEPIQVSRRNKSVVAILGICVEEDEKHT